MRNENRVFLLKWLNNLSIPIQRIEDIGKGVALCMLLKKMDPLFPVCKKDPMTESDYFNNLKLVQLYFQKKNMKIFFPIDKMIKLKLQDNLNTIQWIYRYVIKEVPDIENNTKCNTNSLIDNKSDELITEVKNMDIQSENSHQYKFSKQNESGVITHLTEQVQEFKDQNIKLLTVTDKLKDCAAIIQKERNFYFEKLIQIEKLLVESSTHEVPKDKILKILYKI